MKTKNQDWIGHAIGGRYKVEALLGQGGMSTVYKAYDPNLQRMVAVKLIHPHLSRDPEFVRRFEQEAAAVAQLRHPNIIQVYDFNHDDDIYYMVLDFIPGITLKDWLQTLSNVKRRPPVADAVRIMTAVGDAVAFAHEHGIIHRDLKPGNIMLTPKGQPILMDFGVIKMLDAADYTASGTIVGTAKYMSPEQARGERPDERSDIYSLGVVLYELVAGRPPFEADTTVALLMKHVNEPVPDIRQLQSDLPDELVEVIEKALAKERKDRYQKAAHMTAALKLLGRLSQIATPISGTQSTILAKQVEAPPPAVTLAPSGPAPSVWTKNLVWWFISASAILLLLLLGLGAFFVFSRLQLVERAGQALALAVEHPLPSSTGMVPIPHNTYTVGLDGLDHDHAPARQVELSQYWIDEYEVSNAEYAKFLTATDQQPPAGWPEGNIPTGKENNPVEGVTWDMAAAYCEWAHKRLPTEAEWEVAARGVDGRLYPWGNNQNAVQLPQSGTYPVGTKLTNQSPFGVFDMAGNVWEWVDKPYAPTVDGHKILRGGSNDLLKDMAFRLEGDPNQPTMVASAGIRCAADRVEVAPTAAVADKSVLYEDSFANPGSGWPIQAEGNLFFGYHPPDFYHVEVSKPDTHTAVTHQPNFSDVTVETKVLVDHTDTENGNFRYGLALRRTGDNYYAFTVSPRQGVWEILKSSSAGLESLDKGSVDTLRGIAPKGVTPDKTDSLRVDASGADFVFQINGQPVAEVTDADYSSGEVGFFVETFDETLAHIHYDSLTIRTVEFTPFQSMSRHEDQFADPAGGWIEENKAGAPYRTG